MPVAIVSTEGRRFDLKTAPPDGFVVLRPLSFGEWLETRDKAMTMSVDYGAANRRNGRQVREEDVRGVMNMAQKETMEFEFATCILEHNLMDEHERLLNFKRPADLVKLDPRIGQEIQGYLAELNNFEDDLEDFVPSSESQPA